VVIGGGPGGYAAALYGAAAGLSVAVVEKEKVGGTCLHRGCIPAKQFLETANVFRTVAGAKEFGVQADQPSLDFATSQARKQKVVDQLWKGLQGLMKTRKITTIIGSATLHKNKLVKVDDGTELKGKNVIIATGSVPRTLPGFDVDGKYVMTSDEVLMLEQLPSSVAVIGGGAIGCEFASMMSDLGTQVTLLEALPKLLPLCDSDVTNVVARSFKKRGIDVRTGVKVEGHEPGNGGTTVNVDGDSITVDAIVMSIGRRPLSDDLGLDGTKVGLDDKGYIEVDEYCRTDEDGVFAVGDVINTPQLAHVGYAEGILVMNQLIGEDAVPVEYDKVPWAIYCHPEVGFVGPSEEAAKEAGYDVVVSKHRWGGNGRALIIGDTEGLVKVIAEKDPDGKPGRVLGVHIVGPWATEEFIEGWLSVNWEATVPEVAHLIHPHPTLSESFGDSMLGFYGRGLHG
jgi:dihydrolipoamide dehydrogenase